MANRAKKLTHQQSDPPPLPVHRRGKKSISDIHMRYFLAFFERWIEKNYPEMSDREIADKMGLSSNEVTSWRKDRSRPGLPRALYLRELTGVSLDEMFGPE